jgi:hypothetical protein
MTIAGPWNVLAAWVITVAIAAGSALMAVQAAAQPRCSERAISATGKPRLLHGTARRQARIAWSAIARSQLGDAYASWGRARARNFDCVRAEGRFLCSVSAKPCRAITDTRP